MPRISARHEPPSLGSSRPIGSLSRTRSCCDRQRGFLSPQPSIFDQADCCSGGIECTHDDHVIQPESIDVSDDGNVSDERCSTEDQITDLLPPVAQPDFHISFYVVSLEFDSTLLESFLELSCCQNWHLPILLAVLESLVLCKLHKKRNAFCILLTEKKLSTLLLFIQKKKDAATQWLTRVQVSHLRRSPRCTPSFPRRLQRDSMNSLQYARSISLIPRMNPSSLIRSRMATSPGHRWQSIPGHGLTVGSGFVENRLRKLSISPHRHAVPVKDNCRRSTFCIFNFPPGLVMTTKKHNTPFCPSCQMRNIYQNVGKYYFKSIMELSSTIC